MTDVHGAYRQIRAWLSQVPGVLRSEVIGPAGDEVFVITYDATLSAADRREIADRLRGHRLRFEFRLRSP
jgi:hypothetical protein